MLRFLLIAVLLAGMLPAQQQQTDLAMVRQWIDSGRFIRVRETAEAILRENKDSAMGNYLMGVAMQRGEGNLPLARYYLGRARTLVERNPAVSVSDQGVDLYAYIMFELLLVAGLTEKHEEQIQLVAEYSRLFGVDMGERSGWSLMKLGRHNEARQLMLKYLQSKDPDTRRGALNTLGSIEMSLGNYEEAFRWFTVLKSELTERDVINIATLVRNRAEVANVLLKFDVAESDTLLATKYFHPSSYSNPWMSLSLLYVTEGRLAEAISAIRSMHAWDRRSDPTLEQQRWNDGQQATAIVLLATGYPEAALQIVRRIRSKPDRRGTTSGTQEQAEIGLLFLWRETLRMQREQLREQMVWESWPDWALSLVDRLKVERELWAANSRLNALLVPDRRLPWILRPYAPDSPVTEWMRPGLSEAVGGGLVRTELRKLLERKGTAADRERPYLQAALGESLIASNDWTGGLAALTQARAKLPQEEVLLRTRMEALAARALERSGELDRAAVAWRNAMERNAGIIRLLDLSIPVTLSSDNSPAANATVEYLEKSPRFHRGRGFSLSVSTTGRRVFAQLRGRDGAVLAQASTAMLPDVKDTARLLCREVHRKAFATKIDLSQMDINSLDGSVTSGDSSQMGLRELFGTK
jgi:tetratricopeptide (TPR) repeat protein